MRSACRKASRSPSRSTSPNRMADEPITLGGTRPADTSAKIPERFSRSRDEIHERTEALNHATRHLAEVVMNRSVREALAGKNVKDV